MSSNSVRITSYPTLLKELTNSENLDRIGSLNPILLRRDIYPKSCTSEYCGMLTSSGKCEMIKDRRGG